MLVFASPHPSCWLVHLPPRCCESWGSDSSQLTAVPASQGWEYNIWSPTTWFLPSSAVTGCDRMSVSFSSLKGRSSTAVLMWALSEEGIRGSRDSSAHGRGSSWLFLFLLLYSGLSVVWRPILRVLKLLQKMVLSNRWGTKVRRYWTVFFSVIQGFNAGGG